MFTSHKDIGLVNEVFDHETLASLGEGSIAVGHVRYGTTGGGSRANCQPIEVRHIKGTMAVAHNGNLTNAAELRGELELKGSIFHTTSDTEIIAYEVTRERLTHPSIEEAVSAAMDRLAGSYTLIIMSPRKLIAVRDPAGSVRCVWAARTGAISWRASAARSRRSARSLCAISSRARSWCWTRGGAQHTHPLRGPHALCVFEFIYFARSDSVIDGSSVHIARQRAGAFLALQHPVQADVVIGVPDSGLDAALGYAKQSGIPYDIGFLKNKYIGRTFIAPTQKQREDDVRIKLNPIASVVRGKRVVLVDDSIVRGTTSLKIVKLLREAGAKEVHMRLSAPPFLYPCYFGTDIDSSEHLIAYQHTVEEIRSIIGVDSLGYLDVGCLDKLADNSKCGFCNGCFTGKYPVEPPKKSQKSKFETKISAQK